MPLQSVTPPDLEECKKVLLEMVQKELVGAIRFDIETYYGTKEMTTGSNSICTDGKTIIININGGVENARIEALLKTLL